MGALLEGVALGIDRSEGWARVSQGMEVREREHLGCPAHGQAGRPGWGTGLHATDVG